MGRVRRLVVGVGILSLTACGDGARESPDAADLGDIAVADGSGSGPSCEFGEFEGICAPRPPHGTSVEDCASGLLAGVDAFHSGGVCLPLLPDWECPDGWLVVPGFTDADGRENVPDGVAAFTACEPPDLPIDCPLGWMPRLGEAGCVRQGIECPPEGERWHDEAAIRDQAIGYDGSIVYVAPDGPGDADGSRDAPFDRVGQGVAAAGDGGIVALATGTYAQRVLLPSRVAVVGSCVEQTTIEAPDPHDRDATVLFNGTAANARFTAVSVTGDRPGVQFQGTVSPNVLADVTVVSAWVVGVWALDSSAEVELTGVLIRDIRRRGGEFGHGLQVSHGASATARTLRVFGSGDFGIAADGAQTSLTLRDAVVLDSGTVGLLVGSGATIDAEGLILSGNPLLGAQIDGSGTLVTIRGGFVSDNPDRGIQATGGALL